MRFRKLGPRASAGGFFSGAQVHVPFSANSVSPSQQPQTGFRARISCPPSPAASAGPVPRSVAWNPGSSSSTSFPRSLHETETWNAAADQHSRGGGLKAQLVSSPWPCPLQATPSEMARLLPPPRGVTYAGEAEATQDGKITHRGGKSISEAGGPGHRWSRCNRPTTGPWQGQPHPVRRGLSVRPRPPGSPAPELWGVGAGDPLSATAAQQAPPTPPGGCGGDALSVPPRGVGGERLKGKGGKVDRRRALGSLFEQA